MRKPFTIRYSLFAICLLFAIRYSLFANVYAAGTTSAEFLKILPGSRPQAMGGAFTAVSNDKTALYYNPAGLSQLEFNEIGVMYNRWLIDTSLAHLLYAHTFGEYGSVAAGITYFDSGAIEERGNTKNLIGTYKNTAFAFQVGYGNEFFEGVSFGAAAKFLSETIKDKSTSGFAADFGAHYRTIFDFGETAFGISVQNIGSKIWEEFSLPSLVRAGVGLKPLKDTLTLSADYIHPFAGIPNMGVGIEIKLSDMFVFRSGYRFNNSDVTGLSALTLGFGFHYLQDFDYSFNYSFSTQGDLGLVHRAELGFGF